MVGDATAYFASDAGFTLRSRLTAGSVFGLLPGSRRAFRPLHGPYRRLKPRPKTAFLKKLNRAPGRALQTGPKLDRAAGRARRLLDCEEARVPSV